MKAYKFSSYLGIIAISLSTVLLFSRCLSSDDETLILPDKKNRFVNINDPADIQDALNITDAIVLNGVLPAPSSGNKYLSTSIGSIKVNSGSTVLLPLIYMSSHDIKTVYIQVVGADGSYFSVNPVLVPVTTGDIYGYISIGIPHNIDDGNFTIRYNVKDSSGNISNVVSSLIEVTNEVVSCNNASNSGSSGLTFTTLYLGEKSGTVKISYNTYSVPDRIDIYQGQTWLTGTGSNPNSPIPPMCNCSSPLPGFVGKSGVLTFDFNPKKNQNITVVVSGCLNGGTAWDWILIEAPNCN